MARPIDTAAALQFARVILEKANREGRLPAAAPGSYPQGSFSIQFGVGCATVEPSESYTTTTSVPFTEVVGALAAEAQALFTRLASAMAEECGAEAAEAVLSRVMGTAVEPVDAARAFMQDAARRATDTTEAAKLAAAGEGWAESFKREIPKAKRNGRTLVSRPSFKLHEG